MHDDQIDALRYILDAIETLGNLIQSSQVKWVSNETV
jgi:hypothetical protein